MSVWPTVPFFHVSSLALLTCCLADSEGCHDQTSALQLQSPGQGKVPLTEWLPDTQVPSVYFSSAESYVSEWTSPRDLAILPKPHDLTFADGKVLSIFSAVPSFGHDGNYIALLLTKQTKRTIAYDHPLYCSGPNRSHLTRVLVHHRCLLCPWLAGEAEKESFDVFLEDQEGNSLARVLARRTVGLVKQHHTVACVRDVFYESDESFSAALKQLVEWLEFSLLHGIEHFFVYTFRGTEDAVKEVLRPYLEAGLATRIHFDDYPSDKLHRQHQVVKDCLYRAKSHATWVLPSVDVDEYFHLNSGHIFPDGRVPQDYLKTAWDAIVKSEGKKLEDVRSVSFYRYRFARAPRDALEISSAWREPGLIKSHHHPERPALPKYAYNVHLVYDLWFHYATDWSESEDILISESLGVGNHYRVDSESKYGDAFGHDDKLATAFDDKLTSEVPLLEQAIERRFGEKPQTLLKRLSVEHPPMHLLQQSSYIDDKEDNEEDDA